jgi:RNA polymerase sigma-70 factor (ECF subfamily)
MDQTNQSLLVRAGQGSELAWQTLEGVYRPMIQQLLRSCGTVPQDVEDLTQEVMLKLVKELPGFQHNGRPGAFRTWLRLLTCNCAREIWRNRHMRPQAPGDRAFQRLVDELAHNDSELSQRWDRDHDAHVLRSLLEDLGGEFEPTTLLAFRRLTLEGATPQQVSEETGMTVGALYVVKSRVLRRLRQEAADLLD